MDAMVIPLKAGTWRVVVLSDVPQVEWKAPRLTSRRYEAWRRAYREWWDRKGHRLALSPEMWQTNGLFR